MTDRSLHRQFLHWLGPGRLAIALGVLLLLNPLYVGVLHLDEPGWTRYEAVAVEPVDGGLNPRVEDPDLLCTDGYSRSCPIEHHIHDADGLTIDGWPVPVTAPARYSYVYLGSDGFFETDRAERPDGVELTLRPVAAEEALDGASTRVRDAPAVVGPPSTMGRRGAGPTGTSRGSSTGPTAVRFTPSRRSVAGAA